MSSSREGLARAVGKPSTSEPVAEDGKRSRDAHHDPERERDSKRSRRSRSRERDHDRHRDRRRIDDGGRDDRDRRRDDGRSRDDDLSRDRDRDRYRDGGRGRGRGSPEGPRSNQMAPDTLVSTSAEQHGIYRAIVTNVMDFGAFCELQVTGKPCRDGALTRQEKHATCCRGIGSSTDHSVGTTVAVGRDGIAFGLTWSSSLCGPNWRLKGF